MANDYVQCGECGIQLAEAVGETNRTPCPGCTSLKRVVNVSVVDTLAFHEMLRVKAEDRTRKGSSKIKIEQLVGDEIFRKTGEWVNKVRVIDRENNQYLETITDPKTGKVIHHCEEPLSDHWGHGSDKPKS